MTGFNSAITSRPRSRRDVAAIPLSRGATLNIGILKYDIGDYIDIRYFADGRATRDGVRFPLELAGRLAAVLQSPAMTSATDPDTISPGHDDGGPARLMTFGPDPGNLQERPCEAISGDFSSDKAADMGGREKGLEGRRRRKQRKEAFEILMRAVHGKGDDPGGPF